MTADTHHPPFWREHLLAVLGCPQRTESKRLLDAWSRAEGGTAAWNPLNTTLVLSGFMGHDYNTVPVRNYTAPVAGVCATALTLISRNLDGSLRFAGILGDLQAGTKTAEQIVADRRGQFSLWGTSPDLILTVLKETP